MFTSHCTHGQNARPLLADLVGQVSNDDKSDTVAVSGLCVTAFVLYRFVAPYDLAILLFMALIMYDTVRILERRLDPRIPELWTMRE